MSNEIQQRLLNDYQRDFPLVSMPYARLGSDLKLGEAEVLSMLADLKEAGSVSRVGAVLRPGSVGAGTLAALQVPEDRMAEVAEIVNAQEYVNHNYQREHAWNMWFVVTAPDRATVTAVLQDIERQTGLAVLDLPMVRDYFIDLGFDLTGKDNRSTTCRANFHQAMLEPQDRELLGELEKGLELVSRPFAALADAAGMTEGQVLKRLTWLQEQDIIRRLGVIVRHHELGYNANAMTVWQVAPGDIDVMGRKLGSLPYVRLCYQRRAHANWPYTLYAMIHGKDRDVVLQQIEDARQACGLQDTPSDVLFSVQRFKQTGGRYLKSADKSKVEAA
jgi:siroheme decarboxylase